MSLCLQTQQDIGLIEGHQELCVNGYPLCPSSMSLGLICGPYCPVWSGWGCAPALRAAWPVPFLGNLLQSSPAESLPSIDHTSWILVLEEGPGTLTLNRSINDNYTVTSAVVIKQGSIEVASQTVQMSTVLDRDEAASSSEVLHTLVEIELDHIWIEHLDADTCALSLNSSIRLNCTQTLAILYNWDVAF